MEDIVIVSAKRTPIGKMGKALKDFSAVQLGTIATKAAIQSANINSNIIDQVIFGNVLQAGSGQNVARQIEINSNIPNTSTANTVNQVCGSGMKAIRLGQAAITMGDANIVVVGGTESMSNAPFLNYDIRKSHKLGSIKIDDSLQKDALFDAFTHIHMGETAENVAQKYNVSKRNQDDFALKSQQKATIAQQNNLFNKEIIPIKLPNNSIMSQDEAVRHNTNLSQLEELKPAFKSNGTVTAGNAAGLNDGASAMILMKKSTAQKLNLNPIATIKNYAETGIDPKIMGYAPYYAVNKMLKNENTAIKDFDLIEFNEAFAAQSVAVTRDLNIPNNKLNITGGGIALGHPLGDSGARIITTLIHNLHRTNKHNGLATLCIGGGMGMAMHIKC